MKLFAKRWTKWILIESYRCGTAWHCVEVRRNLKTGRTVFRKRMIVENLYEEAPSVQQINDLLDAT